MLLLPNLIIVEKMIDGLYRPDDFQPTTRSTATRQLASFDGSHRFMEVDILQEELDRWSGNQSRADFDAIELLTRSVLL